MPVSLRRDMALGGVAGLLAGVVFWWALEAQGTAAATSGLLGLKLSGAWLALHLLASIVVGAGFAALSRYQPLAQRTYDQRQSDVRAALVDRRPDYNRCPVGGARAELVSRRRGRGLSHGKGLTNSSIIPRGRKIEQ